MHVSIADGTWPYKEFMEQVDLLRARKGITTDTEFGKLAGVHPSMIGKWRSGMSKPTLESLRGVAHALGVPPVRVWLWSGLVTPEELGLPALPEIYQEAADLDAELPHAKQLQMRTTIRLVVNGLRSEMEQTEAAPRRRRSAS